MAHARTAAEVAAGVGVDPGRGLTSVQAADRLTASGPNLLREGDQVSATRILTAQLTSPMILLLGAAALLGLEVLDAWHWALCVAIALTYFAAIELEKLVINARRRLAS